MKETSSLPDTIPGLELFVKECSKEIRKYELLAKRANEKIYKLKEGKD